MKEKLGTMVGMITQALLHGPRTRAYPSVPAHKYAHTRGQLCIDITNCIYCGLCSKHCVSDAITVNKQERTFTVNRLRCISCSGCVETCPKNCLFLTQDYQAPSDGPRIDTIIGPAKQTAESAE